MSELPCHSEEGFSEHTVYMSNDLALRKLVCTDIEVCTTICSIHGLQAPKKRRLDEVCLEQYPEHSRSVIQSWIAQGKVAINGRVITKAGTSVASQSAVQITAESPKFVCRWGLFLLSPASLSANPVEKLRSSWQCIEAEQGSSWKERWTISVWMCRE